MNGITIENTTCCGANCVMCPRTEYRHKFENMSAEIFQKIVENIEDLDLKQIDIGGYGDPLIDPLFCERVKYLKEHFPSIRLTTISTGQLLEGNVADCVAEYIDNLKISNYGISKNTFESVHRGSLNYEKVKSNIDSFLAREKRPDVIITFLILEQNEKELDEWKDYYQDKVEGIQIWYPHNYVGYKKEYNDFSNKDSIKTCGRVGDDYIIHKNGDISVCCFDFNHDLVVGNIMYDKLSDIEKTSAFKRIFEKHAHNDYAGLVCEDCDQIRDRSKCLYYSSDSTFRVGKKSQRLK